MINELGAGDGAGTQSDECCTTIYQKLMKIQILVQQMSFKLKEDKHEKQKKMHAMLEQIKLLKAKKADIDYVKKLLESKADITTVSRKLSLKQFDAACELLTDGIKNALTKMSKQKKFQQYTLDYIRTEIDDKLTQMGLGPLSESISCKLSTMQCKIKREALKKGVESMHTKEYLGNKKYTSYKKQGFTSKAMVNAVPGSMNLAPSVDYKLHI